MPEDIDQPIRILALDYTSTLFNRKRNRSEPIKKRSERLMLEMISAGIGERPIVFICHSMGGLLVKYLMGMYYYLLLYFQLRSQQEAGQGGEDLVVTVSLGIFDCKKKLVPSFFDFPIYRPLDPNSWLPTPLTLY